MAFNTVECPLIVQRNTEDGYTEIVLGEDEQYSSNVTIRTNWRGKTTRVSCPFYGLGECGLKCHNKTSFRRIAISLLDGLTGNRQVLCEFK